LYDGIRTGSETDHKKLVRKSYLDVL
jgi:hypothetical protein